MKTIEISTGIRLTATNATIERYLREVREEQELRKTIAWLHTPEARECPEYSDIFKDVYGFRPRW